MLPHSAAVDATDAVELFFRTAFYRCWLDHAKLYLNILALREGK